MRYVRSCRIPRSLSPTIKMRKRCSSSVVPIVSGSSTNRRSEVEYRTRTSSGITPARSATNSICDPAGTNAFPGRTASITVRVATLVFASVKGRNRLMDFGLSTAYTHVISVIMNSPVPIRVRSLRSIASSTWTPASDTAARFSSVR